MVQITVTVKTKSLKRPKCVAGDRKQENEHEGGGGGRGVGERGVGGEGGAVCLQFKTDIFAQHKKPASTELGQK